MGIVHSNMEARELRLRLRNCLETILEIRASLDSVPFGASFMPEFGSLENYLRKLEQVSPEEVEVARVELATANFLRELKLLVENGRVRGSSRPGVLQ